MRFAMRAAAAAAILTLALSSTALPAGEPILWVEDAFEDFADGQLDAAGQNLYVSRDGARPHHSPLRSQPGRSSGPHLQQHPRQLHLHSGHAGPDGTLTPGSPGRVGGGGQPRGGAGGPEPGRPPGRRLLPQPQRPSEPQAIAHHSVGSPGRLVQSEKPWPTAGLRRPGRGRGRPEPGRLAGHRHPQPDRLASRPAPRKHPENPSGGARRGFS